MLQFKRIAFYSPNGRMLADGSVGWVFPYRVFAANPDRLIKKLIALGATHWRRW